MPCGNGQTLSKRKHGVCVPRLSFFSTLLVGLCCLEAWGSGPQGDGGGRCSPCPVNCSCALAGLKQSCVVNCSSVGLERAPASADIPQNTNVLDLSNNHISSLDTSLLDHLPSLRELYLQGNRISVLPRGVFCCGPLSILNLSNNAITTIEERICDNLCNLSLIDLSINPFACDCKLFRLVSWLQEKGVRVQDPEAMLCNSPPQLRHQPLLNASLLTCGLNYAGCLEDSSSGGGGRSELVIFSSSTQGNFTREQCNSVCFAASHLYGGLGASHECLCSTNSEPNFISESQCSAACTNSQVMNECGWTVARDVFAVDFSVSLNPLRLQSVHNLISISAASSVTPVMLSWDFGDFSSRVNTTGTRTTTASHKYGLPGHYAVSLKAWAGNKEVSARGDVTVTLPPKLELHCPLLAVANKSIDVTLISWGALGVDVDWRITKDGVQVAKATAHCPKGELYPTESHCFHIVSAELSWTDARQQCSELGGDLGVVRSNALRNWLSPKVTQERGVWLGLSDIESPGKLRWVNGSEAQEEEEGSPPRPSISRGNLCVSLDQRSQTSQLPCTAKRAFVCQYKPEVQYSVPDSGVYMIGLAVFPSHNPLHHSLPAPLSAPQRPSSGIEVLLFPALSFGYEGRLSSLEFVTKELSSQVQVRFQTYRPHCHYPGLHLLLPSCGSPVCSPMAVCVPMDTRISDPPPCPRLEQWCPFQRQCLPLSSVCQPSSCPNCTHGFHLPPGVRRPRYTLQYEVVFTLPEGPASHVVIQKQLEDHLVSPGDIIALQHDAGPASLLQCQYSPHSMWRQPVLALNQSEWFWINNTRQSLDSSTDPDADLLRDPELDIEVLVEDGEGGWLEDMLCPVRVLYVRQSETQLQGEQLSAGLSHPGLYDLLVSSVEPSYPASASCSLRVVPPLGLTILHPALQNGTIYLQPNDTRVLLRVRSGYETKASQHGSNRSVTFQNVFPPEFSTSPVLCPPGPSSGTMNEEPTLYAVLELTLVLDEHRGPLQVKLEAHNNVTEASLTVTVQIEEPLRGLMVQPHPAHRVLMESVVSYTASVLGGSNPTFKWTVDDKPYFTYYNTVLNVIYQHAAVYKLTVTTMNHVSALTEHFNVTVDRLLPMANLTVKGVPDVVPQGSNQTLTTTVLLDMSVAATFRWSFGDGGYKEFEYKPPYPSSLLCPDSPNQVLLSNNVTYIYSQPGIYTALVSVSNRYENISQSINMSVYSILTHVDIQTEPQLLKDKSAYFEAHPLPSPYGIHYEWNFGDGSALIQGRLVAHTYAQSGVFNICVSVNNTISAMEACDEKFVYEEIGDLTAESSSPTELHSPTVVRARLALGNNITWTFSMGDGTIYTPSEPHVSHTYIKDGNYTVNVTAANSVSSGWISLPVQVFVFQVIRMEPSGCVQERVPVIFHALASGNASAHFYQWSFGDESPNETHQGNPQITHTYSTSGNYHLSLLLSSGVNKATKANFFNWICVQPALTSIILTNKKSYYSVGEKIQFQVKAEPEFNYSYLWDFGRGEDPVLVRGSGEVFTTYKNPGRYTVAVTVFNNISSLNASVVFEVQKPIGPIIIQHNGTKYNNLTLRAPFAFTTSSLATNVTYTWNFGDGNMYTGQNINHTYNISGNYIITLKAENSVSSNNTTLAVAVLAAICGLTVNATLVNVPLDTSVYFVAQMEEGDGVQFSWILCDSCTAISGTNTMVYTFRSVGTFNIIVTAENDVGSAQANIFLFVQRELEGLQILAEESFEGGLSSSGCCFPTNRTLHLQAGLKEGTNMTFTWNLIRHLDPVSSIYNSSGKTVDVNFFTVGPCDIFLRAANLLGQLSVNRTIYFLEAIGDVHLHISKNPVAVNGTTNLTVLAMGGSNLQYNWSINGKGLQWQKPWTTQNFASPGQMIVTATVFNEVSHVVVSQTVDVQEVIYGLHFTATNVTEQNYVPAGVNILLQGEVLTGTNVTWTWLLEGRTETGKNASLIFDQAKTANIILHATNNVSNDSTSRMFFVQEKIQGLELRANKKIVEVGENVEFSVCMAAGSDVRLILSISGDATVDPFKLTQTYVHKFSRVDTYMVNLTAFNQVSFKRRSLHVDVMERVQGLSIRQSYAAIPAGEMRQFTANIDRGNRLTFLWTFDLHHLNKFTTWAKEVNYTPQEAGILIVYLNAFNTLSGQNITKHILVQNVLKAAVLHAVPRDTFVYKTVTLMAAVTPRSNAVECLWDFGDASNPVHTNTTTVDYKYRHSGHYLVQVNCSNLVSWVLAQVEVNISVLECEEPEVQVVQASRLTIWRSQPTFVEASVDLKGCARYGAQYLWQILPTRTCDNDRDQHIPSGSQLFQSLPAQVIRLPVEVDVRRLQLSLPKMALAAGNYSLVFTLSYEGVPLRKTACLQLSVMAARLMPIIEGGTYRVWSRTQDLQLSAEQSYDPNMDPESQSLLHYHWECKNTSKGPNHCSTLNFGLGSSGPVLGISGSELEAGVEYTFKLTISKDGMAPESTTQTVLVQNGHIPIVYLECVSCKAQSIFEVSQNSYIYLKGRCYNCKGSYRGRWSAMTLQNETLILDSSSTTTVSGDMNLVLRQGVLLHNDSYIFTLHVTDSKLDGEGVASIVLYRNMPPSGGTCHLRLGGEAGVEYGDGDGEGWRIRTLLDRVHFNCSGYSDLGVSEMPLLYSLLVTRCRQDYCEDFCVYKGSSPEYSAFLPPGFSAGRHRVAVSITVEDHQGAASTALNKSIEVVLPDLPPDYTNLPHWLSQLIDNKLKKLLEQGDSQRVRELSLALITVLNEYEQTRESVRVSRDERAYRLRVRSNITKALTALDVNTVSDIQQTSAALAQCTAVSREFICEECQNSTLNKLESMLGILQTDTKQGIVTPTEIADNILNIMGDLISQSASQSYLQPPYLDSPSPSTSSFTSLGEEQGGTLPEPSSDSPEQHPLHVAAKAYGLSSLLMMILMHGRVLNEEPLVLRGAEIAATGKLADPQSLLCYHGNSPECQQFSIPGAFNNSLGRAAAGKNIVQLLVQVKSNPFPFNYVANHTVSTEVVSMEFRTENGTQIPIRGLDDSQAITVAVNNGSSGEVGSQRSGTARVPTAGSFTISHCDSVTVRVSTGNTNRQAGLFVQLNFTSLEDASDVDQREQYEEPYITAYIHSHEHPNEFNCSDRKHITLNMTRGQDLDHQKYTFFLSPDSYDTTLDYFINVSTPCGPRSQPLGVHLEVGVFACLCQYFSESEQQWRTDGMVPLAETNTSRAVCSTRHLTIFAAGLFVPTSRISFTVPERSGAPSLVVLLVCVLGLLSYVVAAAILHKLDQLDLRGAGVVPLCGRDGLFKYEIQVKTGWIQGAGTTAHVGISLYGRESRSGHRHLDSKGAFTRNALDIFHIATDSNLGSIWKIRIWHDNKGLSPAWMLKYVLVKDLQTGSSYYFLVDDWLSVDNDKTDGRVEIEVEASEEAVLRQLPRLLKCELQRALCDSHLWLSLWERPPRSPFTRLQRATCCAVLLQLFVLANTLWHSIVVDKRYSLVVQAVSRISSLSGETVAAGVVTCLIVYPLYLLVFTVFRMSRSKCVSVEQVPQSVDQESVEIDDFLDNSISGSSLLFFNTESNSEESNVDLLSPSTKSVESWDMAEEEEETVDRELLSEVSMVGGAGHGAGMARLKRGQGSRHLGVDMSFNPDDEEGDDQRNKYFTSSDEDLIKHILADGQNFFPQADESEMADLLSIFGDKTEVILLQKLNEPLPLEMVRRDPPKTAFTSNTVVTDVCRPRRFPPWCGRAALWGSWAVIALANSVSIWTGHGFSQSVAMMWLISCFSSFLCSCLLLEPIKVLCEAVYYAVCVRRLRPEEQDVLVEFPRVERVVQRVPRVRPPQGFALSQARNQARKVHMLHTMLKNFLVYMFFLLVVLLLNYSDSTKDAHSLRLRTQLQQALNIPEYHNVSSRNDLLMWLNDSLLPRLLDNSTLLRDTGSVLLGSLRLRQIRDTQGHFRTGDRGVWSSPTVDRENFISFGASSTNRVWHLGQAGVYNSEDVIHQLNRSLKEASTSLQQLQQLHWLDHRTRAVFVEFSLYNINTNLLAVFSFLFEFPVSERAQSSLDLLVITLWPITGLDLPLLLTIILLALMLYFLVRGILGFLKERYMYLLSAWRLLGICKLTLAAAVCGLHLSRCTIAKQQWASYVKNPQDAFTDFYPLARQTQTYTVASALLLFILVLKASHQLRFLREWAVFGRALRRSVWELLGVAVTLLLLILAYSHTGHLLFHSLLDGYGSVSAACLSLLGADGRGLLSWRPSWTRAGPCSTITSLVFHTSFAVFRLVLLWLVTSVLLRNYRRARAELYRPAGDLQDYEMVELFLRRLKMWMGLSRTKEFRHKVRFEGMDLPPSRSSSTSDCKSLCLPPLDGPDSPPTPDSIDAGSEASWRPASSSPCSLTEAPGITMGLGLSLGLGLGPGIMVGGTSWREKAENEASLRRLLPTLDALLQQLDRVTMATEDLYHMECKLEQAQRKGLCRGRERGGAGQGGRSEAGQREKWEDKVSVGWIERKSGKEKQKGSKKGKKTNKGDIPKDCGNSVANPRKTPVPTAVPFLKTKPVSASAPQSSANQLLSAALPKPVTDSSSLPISTRNTTPAHFQPPKTPSHPPCTPANTPSLPSTSATTPLTRDWEPPTERETLCSSSLFNHPAHTTTIPTRKRKRKPPPLKNKVHPN